jgi:acetyltransferase
VISFGAGGLAGQFALGQEGVDLAPLNNFLAKRLVQRSQIWNRMLSSQVSGPALSQLLRVLELLSDLVAECPEVEALSIDPLVIRGSNVCAPAVDVSLRSGWCDCHPASRGYDHMAIHPYPRQWVETVVLNNGTEVTVRPIRPDDAQALQQFIRGLSDQARYMRFVSMMRELTPRMLARYTQLDYHRELALVATVMSEDASGVTAEKITGLAHYLLNADGKGAEYALVVSDDWQGLGLGKCLMTRLLEAAREQGLQYVEGMVLSSNRPMLTLMTRRMGMRNDPDPDDPGSMRRVWLSFRN